MSLSVMAVFIFLANNSLTAKSRTIEHVDWTTDAILGSVGRLALISASEVPIYWAIDSPQGRLMLKGTCFDFDFIDVIDFDFDVLDWVLDFAFSRVFDVLVKVDLFKIIENININ